MKSLSSTPSASIVPAVNYSSGSYTLTGLVIGQTYSYTMGTNDTAIAFSGGATFAKSALAAGVFTASATSATLTGSGTSAVGTSISLVLGVPLYAATVTPTLPARLVSVGQFPAANPSWARLLQISDQFVFIKRGTYAVAINLADMINLALTEEVNLTWTPPVILTQPADATCAGTAAATGTLTGSGSTNVSDGDVVTIGTQVYRFKTTMAQAFDVQIGGSGNSDTSLNNLIDAINLTGTSGTNWFAGTTQNTKVTAGALSAHAFAVTAISQGLQGNTVATTKTSAVLSWGAATLTGGTSSAITMSVVAGSEFAITYQWQYLNGSTWANISGTVNGTAYTGATTATLTCTPSASGQNGISHRCVVTDDAGSFGLTNGAIDTLAAILTIN